MAGPTTSLLRTSPNGTAERQAMVEHNRLIDDVEKIRLAVVALATAATQSAAVSSVATASTLTAGKLAGPLGVPFVE